MGLVRLGWVLASAGHVPSPQCCARLDTQNQGPSCKHEASVMVWTLNRGPRALEDAWVAGVVLRGSPPLSAALLLPHYSEAQSLGGSCLPTACPSGKAGGHSVTSHSPVQSGMGAGQGPLSRAPFRR